MKEGKKNLRLKTRLAGHIVLFDRNGDFGGFPGGAVVENLPANAGDKGSSLGLGRSHMPRSD